MLSLLSHKAMVFLGNHCPVDGDEFQSIEVQLLFVKKILQINSQFDGTKNYFLVSDIIPIAGLFRRRDLLIGSPEPSNR